MFERKGTIKRTASKKGRTASKKKQAVKLSMCVRSSYERGLKSEIEKGKGRER